MTYYRRLRIAGTVSSFVVGYVAGFISRTADAPLWVPILLWIFAIGIGLWAIELHLFFAPILGKKA